jgi:CheY-like chemotaxis protein
MIRNKINQKQLNRHIGKKLQTRPHKQTEGNPPFTILIIEDNAGDEYLIKKAINDFATSNLDTNNLSTSNTEKTITIHTFHDGQKALDFLRNQSAKSESLRPDIILTGFHLAKLNGLEMIQTIKKDPNLQDIPIIVMSNSLNIKDIVSCYAHFAAGFIIKPLEYDALKRKIHTLINYWSEAVVLPNRFYFE